MMSIFLPIVSLVIDITYELYIVNKDSYLLYHLPAIITMYWCFSIVKSLLAPFSFTILIVLITVEV